MPQSSHLVSDTFSISYIVFGCAKNFQLLVISIRSEEVSETSVVNTWIPCYPSSEDGYCPLVKQWSLQGSCCVVVVAGYLGLIVTLTAYGMYASPPIALTKCSVDVELRATYCQIGVVGTYASDMNILTDCLLSNSHPEVILRGEHVTLVQTIDFNIGLSQPALSRGGLPIAFFFKRRVR